MRDSLMILVNGKRHIVAGDAAFRSLSDYLRYDLGLAGTKVVCSEGDCGSCTVFVGRLRVESGEEKIVYSTICSCIQFMHQLDGVHVVTIEGLTPSKGLNPIQDAMVKCHGAQCGFCTPGIVVTMHDIFEARGTSTVSSRDLKRGLVGNLCRCTGYQSIVNAGLSVDAALLKSIDQLYPPSDVIETMRACSNESTLVRRGDRMQCKPISVDEAVSFRLQHPDCTIIAGGSDIGVLINKGTRDPKIILNLSGIPELRALSQDEVGIHAGTLVSLSELESLSDSVLPEFAKFLNYFGSPPIKNAATIGGNISNGSPIGDSMPALFVLDAEIELAGPQGRRRVNINDFYTGYRRSVMTEGELVVGVHIPLPASDELFKLYKISRRKDLDISAFAAAIRMRVEDNVIQECRIACGGVAATIVRLREVETFLIGAPFEESTFHEAGKIARESVKPISDVRGSSEYRLQLAENIFRKFFSDVRIESEPLAPIGKGR